MLYFRQLLSIPLFSLPTLLVSASLPALPTIPSTLPTNLPTPDTIPEFIDQVIFPTFEKTLDQQFNQTQIASKIASNMTRSSGDISAFNNLCDLKCFAAGMGTLFGCVASCAKLLGPNYKVAAVGCIYLGCFPAGAFATAACESGCPGPVEENKGENKLAIDDTKSVKQGLVANLKQKLSGVDSKEDLVKKFEGMDFGEMMGEVVGDAKGKEGGLKEVKGVEEMWI